MKVFEITSEGFNYAYAAKTESLAVEQFKYDTTSDDVDDIKEVPESKWDEKFIRIHEDNDPELSSFLSSIRDLIVGEQPQFIYTNNPEGID